MNIVYTALREIISAHSVDTSYDLSFYASALTEGREIKGQELRSIGGNTDFTTLYSQKKYRVTSPPLDRTDETEDEGGWGWWREFLSSTDQKEEFNLDLWGTSAVPDVLITVIRDGMRVNYSQRNGIYVSVSFTCRVVV